jgi:hypothetical protein
MISEMEKKNMDELFHQFHIENIHQFFEYVRCMQNLLQDIQRNENEIKKQAEEMEISKMRLMNQEIQVLHHHFEDIQFQIKEYIFQSKEMIQVKKNSSFDKIIQERQNARNILAPFWNSMLQFHEFGLKK